MKPSSKTILVFGVYLVGMGVGLTLTPNLVLKLLGFPASTEVWPHVVGVLALVLAFYYIQAARAGIRAFAQWTVPARIGVFVVFTMFSLLRWVGPTLILVGSVDLVGALWTAWALRREE